MSACVTATTHRTTHDVKRIFCHMSKDLLQVVFDAAQQEKAIKHTCPPNGANTKSTKTPSWSATHLHSTKPTSRAPQEIIDHGTHLPDPFVNCANNHSPCIYITRQNMKKYPALGRILSINQPNLESKTAIETSLLSLHDGVEANKKSSKQQWNNWSRCISLKLKYPSSVQQGQIKVAEEHDESSNKSSKQGNAKCCQDTGLEIFYSSEAGEASFLHQPPPLAQHHLSTGPQPERAFASPRQYSSWDVWKKK